MMLTQNGAVDLTARAAAVIWGRSEAIISRPQTARLQHHGATNPPVRGTNSSVPLSYRLYSFFKLLRRSAARVVCQTSQPAQTAGKTFRQKRRVPQQWTLFEWL